jgi:hypothetical protein
VYSYRAENQEAWISKSQWKLNPDSRIVDARGVPGLGLFVVCLAGTSSGMECLFVDGTSANVLALCRLSCATDAFVSLEVLGRKIQFVEKTDSGSLTVREFDAADAVLAFYPVIGDFCRRSLEEDKDVVIRAVMKELTHDQRLDEELAQKCCMAAVSSNRIAPKSHRSSENASQSQMSSHVTGGGAAAGTNPLAFAAGTRIPFGPQNLAAKSVKALWEGKRPKDTAAQSWAFLNAKPNQ